MWSGTSFLFLFAFPWWLIMSRSLHVLVEFCLEFFVQDHCPFSNSVVFFCCCHESSLCILDGNLLWNIYLKIFSLFCGLPFYSQNSVLWYRKVLNFDEIQFTYFFFLSFLPSIDFFLFYVTEFEVWPWFSFFSCRLLSWLQLKYVIHLVFV